MKRALKGFIDPTFIKGRFDKIYLQWISVIFENEYKYLHFLIFVFKIFTSYQRYKMKLQITCYFLILAFRKKAKMRKYPTKAQWEVKVLNSYILYIESEV